MAKLSALKLDAARASDGVWFRDPWGLGLRFRIASIQSPAFRRAAQAALRMAGPGSELPDRVDGEEEVILKAVAEHLLLEIDGLEDDKTGKPRRYTPSLGIKWGKDPDMQHVIEWVLSKARAIESYLHRTRDDAGKDCGSA
jgi:hypothetical protein